MGSNCATNGDRIRDRHDLLRYFSWLDHNQAQASHYHPLKGVVSPNIEVNWQLQTESYGRKHIIADSKASFLILREGNREKEKHCVSSGEKIDGLPPGKYSVVVNSCDYGEFGEQEFEVRPPTR